MTRWAFEKWGMFSSQFCHDPERPWTNSSVSLGSPVDGDIST